MKAARTFVPERLDVAAFAKARARLEGCQPVDRMTRLAADLAGPVDAAPVDVGWSAEGLWSQPVGDDPQVRLRLRARATVWLACQRCLQPVAVPLEIDRTLRFARNEEEAARLDEEDEEDVLALTRALDLPQLLEDEMILALPLVPRHDVCPQPLPWTPEEAQPVAPDTPPQAGEHPFAALQAWKTQRS